MKLAMQPKRQAPEKSASDSETEATERAVPRKREVTAAGRGAAAWSREGTDPASRRARTARPAADTLMAAGLAFLTSLRSVSMPVSSRSMSIPRSETASSIAFCSRPAGSGQTTPRPQQDARDQLTHDGGLADPLHRFAKQAANQ